MSILRKFNFLGQARLDVPHFRALESSIVADSDVTNGKVFAGEKAIVIRGFTLSNYTAGVDVNSLSLSVADGIVYNVNATEAGTFLWVPSDRAAEVLNSATNARVYGSFTAGQVNYIGLDYVRTADITTTDLVQFQDADTFLEEPQTVPLGLVLDYKIIISTTPFSAASNIIPLAKVKTTASNTVGSATTDVIDARPLMFRLGSGGDFPNIYNSFSWPRSRIENDPLIGSLSGLDKFSGGDKDIKSQKDWQDAVMSRIWEIGGGQNWYSPTADRNVKMVGAPYPSVFASTSDNFEWGIESGVPATGLYSVNHLHWQGLKILFDNSAATGVYYNTVADQTTDDVGSSSNAATSKTALLVGDCIYVDLDRTSNATVVAKKAALQTLGTPVIPGSRYVLAWRTADAVFRRDSVYAINNSYTVATTGSPGSVRLAYAAGTPITPTVAPLDANNAIAIGSGAYTISGNNIAIVATGGGTQYGISASGGPTGGGIYGTGGATSGIGGTFQGTGSSIGALATSTLASGVFGQSSATDATKAGVEGYGAANAANGVKGTAVGTGHGGLFTAGTTGNGVLGTAGSTGANTQAGVKGIGVLAAPGVEGVGTATVGGYGVKGTSSATNTAGVLGISTGGGRGVEGVANASGGIGVYGNTTAVDGSGGYFTAPGTSGLGAAVSAYSLTGRAIFSQGNLEVVDGDVTFDNDYVVKYATTRAEWVRVPLSTLRVGSTTTVDVFGPFNQDSGGTPVPGGWWSRDGVSYDLVGGVIRVPAGATITRIEFLQYTTELTGGVRYRIFKEVDDASGHTVTWGNPSGATFDIVSAASGSTPVWDGDDVSISVPLNNADNSEFGGHISLQVRVDATLANASMRLLGIRLKYTYTEWRTAP